MILSNFMFGENINIYSKLVYIALKKYINKDTNSCFVSKKRLISECGISMSTLNKALNNLVESGVLKKEYRYRQNNSQTSNFYTLTPFLTDGDYYFTIRKDIFNLDLKTKEIIVYSYLCSAANKNMESYPSIKEIALHCAIGETSVKASIKELVNRNLIEKVSQHRADGGRRNNLYRIIQEDNNQEVNLITSEKSSYEESSIEEIGDKHDDEVENCDSVKCAPFVYNLSDVFGQDIVYDHKVKKLFFNAAIIKIIKLKKFKTKKSRKETKIMRKINNNKNETNNMKIRGDIFSFKLYEISLLIYLYINSKNSINEPYFPSIDEISQKLKISNEVVQQSLDELEFKKLIVRSLYVPENLFDVLNEFKTQGSI